MDSFEKVPPPPTPVMCPHMSCPTFFVLIGIFFSAEKLEHQLLAFPKLRNSHSFISHLDVGLFLSSKFVETLGTCHKFPLYLQPL